MNKRDHVLNGVLLGVGLGFVIRPAGDWATIITAAAAVVPVVLGALFPDIDTEFGRHRKTLHNVFVLAALYGYTYFFANLLYVWVGVLTHLVLDMVGSRRGVALLYPLSDTEYGLPSGVTTASRYASVVTVVVTVLELGVVYVLLQVVPGVLPGVDVTAPLRSLGF